MANVGDLAIGDTISFSSKLATDTNTYHGKIVGFVEPEVAVSYLDIYTYNNNVRAIDNSVPETDLLEFILIKLIDPLDNTTKFLITFAKEWVLESSLIIIATERVAVIEVFDIDNANVSDVLDLLRSGGFKARVAELK